MIPLVDAYNEVCRRVGGARLVSDAAGALDLAPATGGRLYVLGFGKVTFPMWEGLAARLAPGTLGAGLLIAPETRFPKDVKVPAGFTALVSDHPTPSARSIAAAHAALRLVQDLTAQDHLVVLISGGGSAAMAAPAESLAFADKRATTTAVARGGATIHELNAVRKHLSAIKGGRLGILSRARTTVLALSDVVGSDPGTIASGPFAPDPTTYAEALEIVRRLGPESPGTAIDLLTRGVAGALPETPKPGDGRLGHVTTHLLAGPERVPDEAAVVLRAAGVTTGLLSRNTEASVESLAQSYGERARHEAAAGGRARILVGNGEPSIVVRGHGRGGRATHLALLMAREIAGLPGVAFLAAGTDDRDGAADASGAMVDGSTWNAALTSGLDPEGALTGSDSATLLGKLGCLVRGPGDSNLLDLHLLAVGAAS